ncbi:hypothetical protein AMTRI_Chr04g183130 [Amborella trichopoda]
MNLSVFMLMGAFAFWFLFEVASYSRLSLMENVLLLLVATLFFWAKEVVISARCWINRLLAVAHDIALGRYVKLFLEVIFSFWVVPYLNSLSSFLTLIYIEVVLYFNLLILYDKYQDPCLPNEVAQVFFRPNDSTV